MKTKHHLLLLASGLISAVIVPPAAACLVEMQTVDYGAACAPLATGDSAELTFQKFDSSLGTLTDIVITLTSKDGASAQVANLDPSHAQTFQNAQTKTTTTVTIAGLGVQTVGALPKTRPWSGTVPGAASLTGPSVSAMFSSVIHVADGGFGAYEADGGGSFSEELTASSTSWSTGRASSSRLFFGYTADTCGSVEIDYCYEPAVFSPIPEAGSLIAGLGVLGLAGISMVRARAKNAR